MQIQLKGPKIKLNPITIKMNGQKVQSLPENKIPKFYSTPTKMAKSKPMAVRKSGRA